VIAASADVFGGHRWNYYGILKKSVEQLATGSGRSAVESKGELVEIIVKMRGTHCPLMCAQEPTF